LLEEGCSGAQIAAAVAALEQAKEREREERLARLREGARMRQQRCRERRRAASRCDSERPPFPLKERSPRPPKENNPQTPGEGAPAREGSRLPADFEPTVEDRAFGEAEGLTPAEIDRAVSDMRLWAAEAAGAKALRVDWHAALRRFLRRDADAKRAKNPPKPPQVIELAGYVHVRRETPQWEVWERYWRETKGTSPPVDRDGGWRFPSEWPPDRGESSERWRASS